MSHAAAGRLMPLFSQSSSHRLGSVQAHRRSRPPPTHPTAQDQPRRISNLQGDYRDECVQQDRSETLPKTAGDSDRGRAQQHDHENHHPDRRATNGSQDEKPCYEPKHPRLPGVTPYAEEDAGM